MRRLKAFLYELPRQVGYYRGPRLASALRKRWVLLRHPHATIRLHPTCYLGPGFSLHVPESGTFEAGPGVEFRRGFRAELERGGRISVGAGTVFTYDVLMQCTTSIDIGERCLFGQATMIVDGSHRFRDADTPVLEQGYDYRPIRIADDVSVMTKCTIIGDIGRRGFVAANSVVTREVPPFTLVGGVPARELDYFGPEPRPASSHA